MAASSVGRNDWRSAREERASSTDWAEPVDRILLQSVRDSPSMRAVLSPMKPDALLFLLCLVGLCAWLHWENLERDKRRERETMEWASARKRFRQQIESIALENEEIED